MIGEWKVNDFKLLKLTHSQPTGGTATNRRNKEMKTDTKIINAALKLVTLATFALAPLALAVVPAPDGGYPGFNTAEGQNALLSLNTSIGLANTAVGWFSLKSNVGASFNTGIGAGTLLL